MTEQDAEVLDHITKFALRSVKLHPTWDREAVIRRYLVQAYEFGKTGMIPLSQIVNEGGHLARLMESTLSRGNVLSDEFGFAVRLEQ